jgi:hypothetical protein
VYISHWSEKLLCPKCVDDLGGVGENDASIIVAIDPTKPIPPNLKMVFDEWCRLREEFIARRFAETYQRDTK